MNAKMLKLDHWIIHLTTGEVQFSGYHKSQAFNDVRIEPQGIRFLHVLAQKQGDLVTKEELLEQIWQDTVVTDDALTRCVSRVRKVLGDNPKQPSLVETLPKRGYRLIASDVQWLDDNDKPLALAETSHSGLQSGKPAFRGSRKGWLLVLAVIINLWLFWFMQSGNDTIAVDGSAGQSADDGEILIAQGDDYYAQIRRLDNEMAIELYQQALAVRPKSGAARAGMANALVQQVLRWPNDASEEDLYFNGLHQAIRDGRTQTPQARLKLQRALDYAQKAVQLAPDDPRTHKALGLVLAARSQFTEALSSYHKAVELNPDAWDALINIGDILQNAGDEEQAIAYFERTFEAMSRVSSQQSVRVRPWRADLGAIIGERNLVSNKHNEAEVWFRHVLSFAPFNRRATAGLVALFRKNGDTREAERICAEYLQRVGENLCLSGAE